jgi:hypothetical protein
MYATQRTIRDWCTAEGIVKADLSRTARGFHYKVTRPGIRPSSPEDVIEVDLFQGGSTDQSVVVLSGMTLGQEVSESLKALPPPMKAALIDLLNRYLLESGLRFHFGRVNECPQSVAVYEFINPNELTEERLMNSIRNVDGCMASVLTLIEPFVEASEDDSDASDLPRVEQAVPALKVCPACGDALNAEYLFCLFCGCPS